MRIKHLHNTNDLFGCVTLINYLREQFPGDTDGLRGVRVAIGVADFVDSRQ